MKLSILVPTYNEIKSLPKVISRLKEIDIEKEIIVIDDGSTDGTMDYVSQLNVPELIYIRHDRNCGKGTAIRTGIRHSKGDIIIIQDADLEYNPDEIKDVIQPIINGEADVVFGSRFMRKNPNIYKTFLWGNKFVTFLINLIFGARFTDTYTCYKSFRSEILKKMNLVSKKFEIEAELSIKAANGKFRYREVPISYNPRTKSEGKKISWRDLFLCLLTILRNI